MGRKRFIAAVAGCLTLTAGLWWVSAGADSRTSHPRTGIVIELTEDFYRAMRETSDQTKTLSTAMSEDYLQQIAVATRYMVETNLQVLRQQEKIIQLLQEIRNRESGK